jgi:hypothetical protein
MVLTILIALGFLACGIGEEAIFGVIANCNIPILSNLLALLNFELIDDLFFAHLFAVREVND